eukprot:6189293-Lingulodinium_polyedra.AAC.1
MHGQPCGLPRWPPTALGNCPSSSCSPWHPKTRPPTFLVEALRLASVPNGRWDSSGAPPWLAMLA